MSYVTGTKELGNVASALRVYNLSQAQVFEPAKNETQWLSFLLKLRRKPVDDAEWKPITHTPNWISPQFYAAGAGSWSSNAIANLAVENTAGGSDNVGYLVAGMLLRVRHQAGGNDTLMVVTNVDSQQQIDVASLPGQSSNETNIADGDRIQVVGEAMGETSSAASAVDLVLTTSNMYAQEFERSWAMSRVSRATVTFGPDQWAYQAREALRYHKTSINRAMLLSTLDKQTRTIASESVTVRSSYGAVTFCEDNSSTLMDSQGVQSPSYLSYSYDDFVDDMEGLFALGSSGKVAVCGSSVLGFFSKINSGTLLGGANVNIETGANSFGLKITRIESPFGTLNLLWDKVFRGDGFYKDYMACIDMDYVSYRPVIGNGENLDTHLIQNLQNNNAPRVRKDGYFTVAGLEITTPQVHGLFKFS